MCLASPTPYSNWPHLSPIAFFIYFPPYPWAGHITFHHSDIHPPIPPVVPIRRYEARVIVYLHECRNNHRPVFLAVFTTPFPLVCVSLETVKSRVGSFLRSPRNFFQSLVPSFPNLILISGLNCSKGFRCAGMLLPILRVIFYISFPSTSPFPIQL